MDQPPGGRGGEGGKVASAEAAEQDLAQRRRVGYSQGHGRRAPEERTEETESLSTPRRPCVIPQGRAGGSASGLL